MKVELILYVYYFAAFMGHRRPYMHICILSDSFRNHIVISYFERCFNCAHGG